VAHEQIKTKNDLSHDVMMISFGQLVF